MTQYITDTSTPASKVIHLDSAHAQVYLSKDVDDNNLTSQFIYHMNESINCPNHMSMICSLHTVTIPYSFYNVRHGINNELILILSGTTSNDGTYKLLFPSGNYTAISFLNTFLDIMNSVNDGSGINGLLQYTWDIGQSLYRLYKYATEIEAYVHMPSNPFLPDAPVFGLFDKNRIRYTLRTDGGPESTTLSINWAESTCNSLFGFRQNNGTQQIRWSSTSTFGLTSDKVIDMNDDIHGLYLRTSLTTDGTLNAETGIFSNILSRIPINTNPGGVIFHVPSNSSHKLQISMPNIKSIGVKLTDDQNNLIDLNGLNWQLSVQIDFVERLKLIPQNPHRLKITNSPLIKKETNSITNDVDTKTRNQDIRRRTKIRDKSA